MNKRFSVFILFFLSLNCSADAYLDSLWGVWKDPSQSDETRLRAVGDYAWDGYLYSKPDSAFYFAQLLHDFAAEKGLKIYMADGLNIQGLAKEVQGENLEALRLFQECKELYVQVGDSSGIAASWQNIGSIYESLGDYPRTLSSYQKSLRLYEGLGKLNGMARSFNNIGIVYKVQNELEQALKNFEKGRTLFTQLDDKRGIANSLQNIGIIHYELNDHEKAFGFYMESLDLYRSLNDDWGAAAALNNIGSLLEEQQEYTKALEYYNQSMAIREQISDDMGIARTLHNIGNVHNDLKEHRKARSWCSRSLDMALKVEGIREQRDACNCLYTAFKSLGNANEALKFHEQMLVMDDSLQSVETFEILRQMEFQNKLITDSLKREEEILRVQMQHEEELHRKETSKNIFLGSGLFLLLVAGGLYGRNHFITKNRDRMEMEKNRFQTLLLNILPLEVAEELNAKGKAEARDFEGVSVMFTDFKDFTESSAKLSAHELVEEINICFEAFDQIVDKYEIEKIKTIGDSYMAAGGIPKPSEHSARNTVLAALDMHRFIAERKIKMDAMGMPSFEMRVGIHTGPVVAGIVGVKKFQYDLWGDTVNTASRMESSSAVGQVNVSETTFNLVKDDFAFDYRGEIEAKGKGRIKMYFLRKK